MTISYPLTLPSNFDSLSVMASNVQGRNTNLYTNKEQIYSHAGDCWKIHITYPRKVVADARRIQAFLLALRGGVGTFIAGDPFLIAPSGVGGGIPLVSGGGQTGYSLNTKGWPVSTSNILKEGDYLQIGTYNLHCITKDVSSNGSGLATLDIWPRIRTSPSADSPLTLNSPKCLYRLKDGDVQWSVDKEGLYDFFVEAVEAL